ncbi:hypothetical protein ACDH50_00405 [Xanthomonas fragariae]|nr:hypothetical protein [Xanthomonas fragariae]
MSSLEELAMMLWLDRLQLHLHRGDDTLLIGGMPGVVDGLGVAAKLKS